MIIVLNCPGCKKRYELDGALAGKKSRCQRCGEVFRIPVPTARVIEPAGSPAVPPPASSPRTSSWDAPTTAATAPQASWTVAPLADLLDGEPVARDTSRPTALPPVRAAESGPTFPAPIASSQPASPPEFEDDLPPPPRAGYLPTRWRRSSEGDAVDTDVGFTALGLFLASWVLLLFGMFIYLVAAEPSVDDYKRVAAWCTGIMMFVALCLWLWGVVWLLGLAFRLNLSEGLLCLLVPFYAIFFAARRWEQRRGAFVLTLTPVAWYLLSLLITLFISFVIGFMHRAAQGLEHSNRANESRQPNGPLAPNLTPIPPAAPQNVPRFQPVPEPVPDIVPNAAPPRARSQAPDPEVPLGADPITRSLIELKSSDKGKRKQAVERLQRTTPDGRVDQVVAALVPLLEDDDGFFVSDVVKTLAVWRSPEAMAALIGRLRENRHFVRSDAIKALGKYREPRAAEAIVTVIKEDGFAVEDALKSLGEVAEPAVITLLRSPDSGVRRHACQILAEIGGQKTLVEMQSLPTDPDFGVRVAAQDAWNRIAARVGPPPKPSRGKTGKTTGR
jgi:hypothetical protein